MRKILLALLLAFTCVIVHAQNEFITTWKTDNPGASANNQITIPTFPGETYDYSVDWGDGTSHSNITGDFTYTYAVAGTYQVKISGVFPRIYFTISGDDNDKLISVDQWGNNNWSSMQGAFFKCRNMNVLATDVPDLSLVTDTSTMFSGCSSLIGNSTFDNWQVGGVTNMQSMFGSAQLFNQPLSNWDVSNVTDMTSLFNGASSFNRPIGNWDTGNVTNMQFMFAFADSFNQPVGNWDVSKVTDMTGMFNLASAFNQPIGNWNVGQVTIMWDMFSFAPSFDQDLSNWDVSNVTDMFGMFRGVELSTGNYNGLLDSWSNQQLQNGVNFHGGNSEYCESQFERQKLTDYFGWTITDGGRTSACPPYTPFITTWRTNNAGTSGNNQITIPTFPGETYDYTITWGDGNFDTNVTGNITHTYDQAGTYVVSISGTFPRIYFFGQGDREKILEVNEWGPNVWSSFQAAFNGCSNLDIVANDVPDLSQVTVFDTAFANCSSLVGNHKFNDWDVSAAVDMGLMFVGAGLFNQDISNWDVSNADIMHDMFSAATSFNQEIGTWDVSGVTDMSAMFRNASSFNGDISSWNVSNLDTTIDMFQGASAFNQDISNWNVGNVRFMAHMFRDASSFNQDIGSWNVANVFTMNNMFQGASAFNQDIGAWNVGKVQFMSGMFADAINFDQDLGNWNIQSITGINNMFTGATLSVENYESLLNGWSSLPSINNGLTFDGGNSQYCDGNAGRQQLIDTNGWTITDGGDKCSFKTTWRTNNPGISANNQITIPTFPGETYNYTIDWGDGTSDVAVTGDITHTYATSGTYSVSINGTFPRIHFNYETGSPIVADEKKLISIDQWGSMSWSSMVGAFYGCVNLDVNATDVPDLSNVTSTNGMFRECSALVGNASFNDWNVSSVTDMATMFFQASEFNAPMNNWDVSNVTTFGSMFLQANKFDQPLGNWNLTSATNIGAMFAQAATFNQDVGNWNVSSVTTMDYLFSGATKFNHDLSNWDVSNVTGMRTMFQGTEDYNQDMSAWNVGKVQRMDGMFRGANAFNQDISSWNVENVTLMKWMFSGAGSFNQDISNWNVGNVTDMEEMFMDASSFDQPIGNWDVSKVTEMASMFEGASSFDQDLGDWNVSLVNDMSLMFQGGRLSTTNYDATLIGWSSLPSLKNGVPFNAGSSMYCQGAEAHQNIIDNYGWTISDGGKKCPFVTTWNTDNPGESADNQITIPIDGIQAYNYEVDWGDGTTNTGVTGNITHTYANAGTYQVSIFGQFPTIAFRNQGDAKKLISVDQWGEIQWGDMIQAFKGCSNMDVLATDTPDLTNSSTISGMFANCSALVGNESFNEWDVSQVTWMTEVFNASFSFNQDIGKWDVGNVLNMGSMFIQASSFNQDISNWNVSNVTSMQAMFQGAESFNQDIGDWDVSKVENMLQMFVGARTFNQDIGGWDVGAVTKMYSMFGGAYEFNQDIGDWDVSNVVNLSRMFEFATDFDQDLGNWQINPNAELDYFLSNAGLSTKNYDKLLIGWQDQTLKNNVDFGAGSSRYCDGETARQNIIDTFGWTITDAGKDVNCNVDNDNDGVLDHLDLCLETPQGSLVNSDGCLELPIDNFTVETIGETCPDQNNAQIIIGSAIALDFVATVNGTDYSFANQLTVDDLEPGVYDICITLASQSLEQCFVLELAESESISGKSSVENGKMTIEIEQGTAPYNVIVNNKTAFQTSLKTFDVDISEGDVVAIKTAKVCEGSFSKTVNLSESIAYPNPTKGSFEIAVPIVQTEVEVEVFTLQSQLISKKTYSVKGGKVLLNIEDLPNGVYIVKVNLENPKIFKIVKQ